jgi:RNA polymerase sigma factor (sigma-70 family)
MPAFFPAPPARPRLDWSGLAASRDSLVHFLAPRCRDVHEAEDLTHETLLRAARFRRGQADPVRLRSWLVQIAANVHRDHVKRESRFVLVAGGDAPLEQREAAGPREEPILRVGAGEYSEGEVLSALDLAWSELAPRDRCVLDAFYADGGSTDVAARACAIRRENVKVCLHRARRRLEQRIRVHLVGARTRQLTARLMPELTARGA